MIIITYHMTFVIKRSENIHYCINYIIDIIKLIKIRGDLNGCKSRKFS